MNTTMLYQSGPSRFNIFVIFKRVLDAYEILEVAAAWFAENLNGKFPTAFHTLRLYLKNKMSSDNHEGTLSFPKASRHLSCGDVRYRLHHCSEDVENVELQTGVKYDDNPVL